LGAAYCNHGSLENIFLNNDKKEFLTRPWASADYGKKYPLTNPSSPCRAVSLSMMDFDQIAKLKRSTEIPHMKKSQAELW
jgi:hypothetical protein